MFLMSMTFNILNRVRTEQTGPPSPPNLGVGCTLDLNLGTMETGNGRRGLDSITGVSIAGNGNGFLLNILIISINLLLLTG